MTDRYSGYIVVLENDIREDDAESTINAIKHIKGVLSVTPHTKNMDEVVAYMRFKNEFLKKLNKIFEDD